MQFRLIWKRFEPFMHEVPGYRKSDQAREADECHKALRYHGKNACEVGAEHLADADLFLPLLCCKRDEAHQAEAGNDDRKHRKRGKDLAAFLVGRVLQVEILL